MGEGELEIKDSSMRHKWSVKSLYEEVLASWTAWL